LMSASFPAPRRKGSRGFPHWTSCSPNSSSIFQHNRGLLLDPGTVLTRSASPMMPRC
jgi:hypothetical protein